MKAKNKIMNFNHKAVRRFALLTTMACALGASSFAQTYCTPTTYYGCMFGDEISNVTLTGLTVTLNNSSACSTNGYGDYTSLAAPDLTWGHTFTGSIATDYFFPSDEDVQAWIDYNDDGTFSSDEVIATINGLVSGGSSFSFTVPMNAKAGLHRMRVRLVPYTTASTIDPCANYFETETEDYTVKIGIANNAGVDSLLVPNSSTVLCSGQQLVKVRVSNLGSNPIDSVKVNWTINGVPQPMKDLVFTPSLDSFVSPNHSTSLSLGMVTLPLQTPVNIKVWTSMPNGVPDGYNGDDTLKVTLNAPIQGITSHITVSGDTPICHNSLVVLNAGTQPQGSLFSWSTGSIVQQTAVHQGGTYTVIVQSPNGCFAYDTITIANGVPAVLNYYGVVANGNNTFTFTPAGAQNIDNFYWDFGDGTKDTLHAPTPVVHQYTQIGTFGTSLTVTNNCGTIVKTKQVFAGGNTGIQDLNGLSAAVNVYPNPASDLLYIGVTKADINLQNVTLIDMMGRKVLTKQLNSNTVEIPLKGLAEGVYQLQVQTNKGMASKRFEILR